MKSTLQLAFPAIARFHLASTFLGLVIQRQEKEISRTQTSRKLLTIPLGQLGVGGWCGLGDLASGLLGSSTLLVEEGHDLERGRGPDGGGGRGDEALSQDLGPSEHGCGSCHCRHFSSLYRKLREALALDLRLHCCCSTLLCCLLRSLDRARRNWKKSCSIPRTCACSGPAFGLASAIARLSHKRARGPDRLPHHPMHPMPIDSTRFYH